MIYFCKAGSIHSQSPRSSGHGFSISLSQDLPSIVSLLSASSPKLLIHTIDSNQLSPLPNQTSPILSPWLTVGSAAYARRDGGRCGASGSSCLGGCSRTREGGGLDTCYDFSVMGYLGIENWTSCIRDGKVGRCGGWRAR